MLARRRAKSRALKISEAKGRAILIMRRLGGVSRRHRIVFEIVSNLLVERDCKHKFTLWRGLKPKLGKLEKLYFSGIDKIYKFPTVHAVARKSVRVPGHNAACFSFFNTRDHFVKYGTTGNLG